MSGGVCAVCMQATCGEAVELCKEKQIDQVPILNDTGLVSCTHTTAILILVHYHHMHFYVQKTSGCLLLSPPSLSIYIYSNVLGMVTLSNLTSKIVHGKVKTSDPVTAVAYNQFHKVHDLLC